MKTTKTKTKAKPTKAYILAGGQSRRLGQDKLFVTINGEQLLSRTIRICREVFPQVSIVAKDSKKFHQLETPVIIDYPNAPGPLGGVIAALTNCPEESCFIVAADFADLDPDTLHRLNADYSGEDFLGISESNNSKHIQPLCGIYAKSAMKSFLTVAQSNQPYQLWRIVESLNYRTLPLNKKQWRNINTPADIKPQSPMSETG